MIIESEFKPRGLLANRHLQTLLGPLTMPVKHQPDRWQSIELSNDDFMEVAWFGRKSQSLLLMLHGLEGSYKSHYIQRVLTLALRNHWQVAVLHFRSCGPRINARMESYHSGVSHDLQEALPQIINSETIAVGALGFSLGGNVLLKWLGENPEQQLIQKAMTVSVPLRLDICASSIDRGFSKLYQKHLIDQLKRKTHHKMSRQLPGPQLSFKQPLKTIKNFWQFDDAVTAPLHGFESATDYYNKASSFYFLPKIKTPTLVLQSLDDPFMSPDVIPTKEQLGTGVTLEVSRSGGHVGFIDHWQFRQRSCFLAEKVARYFSPLLG